MTSEYPLDLTLGLGSKKDPIILTEDSNEKKSEELSSTRLDVPDSPENKCDEQLSNRTLGPYDPASGVWLPHLDGVKWNGKEKKTFSTKQIVGMMKTPRDDERYYGKVKTKEKNQSNTKNKDTSKTESNSTKTNSKR